MHFGGEFKNNSGIAVQSKRAEIHQRSDHSMGVVVCPNRVKWD